MILQRIHHHSWENDICHDYATCRFPTKINFYQVFFQCLIYTFRHQFELILPPWYSPYYNEKDASNNKQISLIKAIQNLLEIQGNILHLHLEKLYIYALNSRHGFLYFKGNAICVKFRIWSSWFIQSKSTYFQHKSTSQKQLQPFFHSPKKVKPKTTKIKVKTKQNSNLKLVTIHLNL